MFEFYDIKFEASTSVVIALTIFIVMLVVSLSVYVVNFIDDFKHDWSNPIAVYINKKVWGTEECCHTSMDTFFVTLLFPMVGALPPYLFSLLVTFPLTFTIAGISVLLVFLTRFVVRLFKKLELHVNSIDAHKGDK